MKTVLITGASSKICQSSINKFLDNGYQVITTYYKNKIDIENVTSYYLDIKDEASVKSLISNIKNDFGTIDILINNIGICKDSSLEEKSIEDFKNIIDVNLTGTFMLTKHIKEVMNNGSILNITSTNGIDTYYPESVDYDASKAGVISLTHNFAKAYAPNIRVNALALGWVNTDMNKDMFDEFKKQEEEKILLKRFATPEEIANVIYFISSDEASYINNSIIRVDGGKNE